MSNLYFSVGVFLDSNFSIYLGREFRFATIKGVVRIRIVIHRGVIKTISKFRSYKLKIDSNFQFYNRSINTCSLILQNIIQKNILCDRHVYLQINDNIKNV